MTRNRGQSRGSAGCCGCSRTAAWTLAAIAAVVLGGCGGPAVPPTTPAVVATAAPSIALPAPTPGVTTIPSIEAGAPPAAMLAPVEGGASGVGTLGGWTWGDAGDDAPWIVPPQAWPVTPGTALEVRFDPARIPESWAARWAPVVNASAGDPASSSEGDASIALRAPGDAGTWSLQVDARFGDGRQAAWYWRVEVRP